MLDKILSEQFIIILGNATDQICLHATLASRKKAGHNRRQIGDLVKALSCNTRAFVPLGQGEAKYPKKKYCIVRLKATFHTACVFRSEKLYRQGCTRFPLCSGLKSISSYI